MAKVRPVHAPLDCAAIVDMAQERMGEILA
jgi:hypothetical protein